MSQLTQRRRKNRIVVKRPERLRLITRRRVIVRTANRHPLTNLANNRLQLEAFLQDRGGQIEVVNVPLWDLGALTVFGIAIGPPLLPLRRYRNLNGTLRDFVAFFDSNLKFNRAFDPINEFRLFLFSQMDATEVPANEANLKMSFIGNKKHGRKRNEETDLILKLRRSGATHGGIAEALIARRFPGERLAPVKFRNEKTLIKSLVAKTISYHLKINAEKKRRENYFHYPRNFICISRTGDKFFIVESSGDDPPK